MGKKIIHSEKAPAALGPYSQAVRAGDTLYCSGQVGIDASTGKVVDGGVTAQAKQVMKNLESVLTEAGLDFSHVVRATIFLRDMNDFQSVNEVYGAYFPSDPPARATVAVAGLPADVSVEISCVAFAG